MIQQGHRRINNMAKKVKANMNIVKSAGGEKRSKGNFHLIAFEGKVGERITLRD